MIGWTFTLDEPSGTWGVTGLYIEALGFTVQEVSAMMATARQMQKRAKS